ncbi:unnamed protein product [Ectocarpus sp. CCAP 1310/34]|nr:unnamed protein product [Ectocarpus sp. CCAP 1310/34]
MGLPAPVARGGSVIPRKQIRKSRRLFGEPVHDDTQSGCGAAANRSDIYCFDISLTPHTDSCAQQSLPFSASPVYQVPRHQMPAGSAAAAAATTDAPDDRLLVVVTGGSKGIGRSCVESFARRGARVLFTYCSDAKGAEAVAASFQPAGVVQGRRLDQGDFDSVRAFAAEVDRWRGGREISAVVNNAALGSSTVSNYCGLPPPAPVSSSRPAAAHQDGASGGGSTADDDFEAARRRADEDMALMRVNALGPMWVTEALLPMMVPRSRPAGENEDPLTGAEATETAAAANGGGREGASAFPCALGSTKKKKTVLFVGSVGGGSHAVFPGFRYADAMSKAAVAYGAKYMAARSRQLRQQQDAGRDATARADNGSSAGAAGGAQAATAATAESDFDHPSGGVDFLCLCPGATLTDMLRTSTLDAIEARGPGELERFLRALPQGRLMLPEEVGEAVYWFCSSPAATMFHGAVIDASAGLAVRPGALTEYTFSS